MTYTEKMNSIIDRYYERAKKEYGEHVTREQVAKLAWSLGKFFESFSEKELSKKKKTKHLCMKKDYLN